MKILVQPPVLFQAVCRAVIALALVGSKARTDDALDGGLPVRMYPANSTSPVNHTPIPPAFNTPMDVLLRWKQFVASAQLPDYCFYDV